MPPSGHRPWRSTFVAVWAAALTLLLGLTFLGTTALTIALWSTDPGKTHTNPVVDLAFFALGGILVTVGIASQVWGGHVAGLQQAVLAAVYAAAMLSQARGAGPSCFLGQCAQGDRLAEAAALAVAVVLVALLASLRTPGWALPAWCAGVAAVVLGAASWLFPGEPGALAAWHAGAAVFWGVAFVAVALAHTRPSRVR